MKKVLLGLCLAALGSACHTTGANMADSSCTSPDCSECSAEAKASCTSCSQGDEQVCPVTGKSMH